MKILTRHPILVLILANLGLLVVIGSIAEIVLRVYTPYDIAFYAGYDDSDSGTALAYPYGTIPINSLGYADAEFNLASPQARIGYFGDSVNYGVGAGYPYRFSEIVESALPQYEHWNIGRGVGANLESNRILEAIETFQLSHVVYLFNLNDLHPLKSEQESPLAGARRVLDSIDFLRRKSYLFNFVRTTIKNALQRLGYGAGGYLDYEKYPDKYRDVIVSAVQNLNMQITAATERNVTFCVVILPYEMQISADAARTYKSLGFSWEDGFLEGTTQRLLISLLSDQAQYFDGRINFDEQPVGTYFVYNLGDKIDFNHPNRAGHKVLAESFLASDSCAFLK